VRRPATAARPSGEDSPGDDLPQPAGVGREHDPVGGQNVAGPVVDPEVPRAEVLHLVDPGAGADVGPEALQVAGQRVPQGHVVARVGHVEQQALARAEEVQVKHHRQLGRRQLGRVGEEAAGEHVEGKVPGRGGKVHPLQERLGVGVVEPVVDAGDGDRGQRCGRGGADRHQVAELEAGAAQGEGERVPGRGAGQAAEGVGPAARVHQGVVGHRDQPGQVRVGPAQQRPQVVVLAEEGVKAAAHRQPGAIGGGLGPAADPAAELALALEEGDLHAAFG
jgi:hypothetical protein